jgi:hypothetical protein
VPLGRAAQTAERSLSNRAFRAGLIVLVLLYVAVASWQYSPALFGAFHDDTLYFSAAKAISEGDGNVFPSLPGSPPQTKYPPLYPRLLSFVWQLQPEFPSNLVWGWRLNILIGIWTILAAVGVLRRLGCSRNEALGLAALFALNPFTILWTNLLLSDLLFAALTLTAIWAADRAVDAHRQYFARWWTVAIVFAYLAILTRTLGVAALAGLAVYALSQKKYVAAAAASIGGLPIAWRLVGSWMSETSAGPPGTALSGFDQNWIYYTDYLEFWHLSVPNGDVLWAQTQFMFLELLKYPAVAAFQFNAEGFVSMFMQASAVAISAAIIHGVVLRAQRTGWSATHWIAAAYIPVILLWNYALMSRFCLPFLPLLLAGASCEFIRLARGIRNILRDSPQKDQKIAAGLMGAALVALLINGAWRFAVDVPRSLRGMAIQREQALPGKREAYSWLAAQADPNAVVISYEDALAYLYSGSKGMRPFAASTAPFFLQDEAAMKLDIARLGDTAIALNARYWLVSDGDFELDYAKPQLIAATAEMLNEASVAFQSSDGTVRVYELSLALTSWAK